MSSCLCSITECIQVLLNDIQQLITLNNLQLSGTFTSFGLRNQYNSASIVFDSVFIRALLLRYEVSLSLQCDLPIEKHICWRVEAKCAFVVPVQGQASRQW